MGYPATPGFSPNWSPGDPPEDDEDFTTTDVEEEFPGETPGDSKA